LRWIDAKMSSMIGSTAFALIDFPSRASINTWVTILRPRSSIFAACPNSRAVVCGLVERKLNADGSGAGRAGLAAKRDRGAGGGKQARPE